MWGKREKSLGYWGQEWQNNLRTSVLDIHSVLDQLCSPHQHHVHVCFLQTEVILFFYAQIAFKMVSSLVQESHDISTSFTMDTENYQLTICEFGAMADPVSTEFTIFTLGHSVLSKTADFYEAIAENQTEIGQNYQILNCL